MTLDAELPGVGRREIWGGLGSEPSWAYLFETERTTPQLRPESGRHCVQFSVLPAVNTRWDSLGLRLKVEDDEKGALKFSISELLASPSREVVRTLQLADKETGDLRWSTVDECDAELARIEALTQVKEDERRKLGPPPQTMVGAVGGGDVALMSEIDTVAEQDRARLQRELTELRQREESLRHCREVKLRQGRLKVQCRVTAFLHPAADCSPNGRGGSALPLAAQRYLQEIKMT
eukprot:COSAG04_NODE_7082_length_1196_cov_0.865087_2_plen_234_part_01